MSTLPNLNPAEEDILFSEPDMDTPDMGTPDMETHEPQGNIAAPMTAPTITEEPNTPNGEETVRRAIDNVPIRISAVLGKTKITIADLKNLTGGAIIELDQKVGEPIDLYVNDRLIARGELVMIDGSLGVTMTEIVTETEL